MRPNVLKSGLQTPRERGLYAKTKKGAKRSGLQTPRERKPNAKMRPNGSKNVLMIGCDGLPREPMLPSIPEQDSIRSWYSVDTSRSRRISLASWTR